MVKWLFSLLAFIILAISITTFTMNVFITDVDNSFESAKANALQRNDVVIDQTISDFYSNLDESQKQTISQIESFAPALRETVLGPQCMKEDLKTQFFCDERFLKGTISFDDVLRENMNKEVDDATSKTMNLMREKLTGYKKFNLVLIGIICAVASFLMYIFLAGKMGIKKFFGSIVWISVFSAISFKSMPSTIDSLISVAAQESANEAESVLMKQMMSEWLIPAMNSVFVLSMWLAVISFVIWLILKLFIENEISVN